jgi:type IV pilus assembly protein PilY1
MPDADKTSFSVFKLASLGNGNTSGGTHANDRRFFYEPDIVRAYITETIDSGTVDENGKAIIVKQNVPYDAILLGSGDRTNPVGNDNADKFFMIKDINIKTQQFTSSTIPATPTPIIVSDLADYTDNPFGEQLTSQEKETLSLQVSQKSGWYIDFEQTGEKNTASSVTLNNVVYFTSYTPPSLGVDSVSCNLPNGQGWLYAVDLSLGISKFNWSETDSRNRGDRTRFVSEQFLDSPTIIVTTGKPTGTDEGSKEKPIPQLCIGRECFDTPNPYTTERTYLYLDETP